MNPKIEINSLSITKLNNEQNSFVKYNIDASIDEIKNTDTEIKLKYRFVLMSNPTNTKINVEGMASIYGEPTDIAKHLSSSEKNIPLVVNTIYQEIFPLFYVISKSMQIPCPAYKLHQMSTSQKPETVIASNPPQVEESLESKDVVESNANHEIMTEKPIQIEQPQEQIIETPTVSSV
jgi:hypothetical protein